MGASLGDLIGIDVILEQQGKQFVNTFYGEIDDLGTDPEPVDVIEAFATDYRDALDVAMSNDVTITCAVYRNISDPTDPPVEKFLNLPGLGAGEPVPTNAVLYMRRYGLRQSPSGVVDGRIILRGIDETKTDEGRYVDQKIGAGIGIYGSLELFLITTAQFPAGGYTLVPGFFYKFNVGGFPDVLDFSQTLAAYSDMVLKQLEAGNTNLCAVG